MQSVNRSDLTMTAIGRSEVWTPLPRLRRDLAWIGGAGALTVVLLSVIFPPVEWWFLAPVALAPWAVAVARVQRAWVVHWGSFLFGWLFFLVNLYWLWPVTGLGYVALAFYLALYWPAAAWAVRTGRRAGISLAWTLPVAWVACEYLRGWVMTGFPWFFLAHGFYKQLAVIQISDLTGAYGVSFLAAMVAGTIAGWIADGRRHAARSRMRVQLAAATVLTLAAWGAALGYGVWRLRSSNYQLGPKVAVIQEDFPLITTPPYAEHPFVVFARYLRLGAQAAIREKPDLIVFPETVWSATQNIGFLEMPRQAIDETLAVDFAYGQNCHQAVAAFARGDYKAVNAVLARLEGWIRDRGKTLPRLPPEGGPAVTVVVGSTSIDVQPEATYPRYKKYNSVLIYDPDGTQRRTRYDKIHLVPFGEVVPFRNARLLGMDLHWLYRWLNSLSPFSEGGKREYSLWRGQTYTIFTLQADGRTWRFGTPICYEDTMAYVCRNFVWDGSERRADFLLNLSNDGWFLRSSELPQHLSICVFRAVENRVGIARAVNTGISGFIAPDGRLYGLVEKDGRLRGPGVIGYSARRILVDTRASFYGRFGDVFAIPLVVLTSLLWLGGIITRWIYAARVRIAVWLKRRRTAKT